MDRFSETEQAGFIRAFWRRIWRIRDDHMKELPAELPVEFISAFGTASMCLESVDQLRTELAQAKATIEGLQLNANRWQALINSPFRLFGYAGLDHDDPTKPCNEHGAVGYAHFGCEMWTIHSGREPHTGKEVLIGFADQAIKVQALNPTKGADNG